MWARIHMKLWVEVFDQHVGQLSSLYEELMIGFDRSMRWYFSRAQLFAAKGRFYYAVQGADWDKLSPYLAESKSAVTGGLGRFVSVVRPLLQRMYGNQSSLGLEDPRTPRSAYGLPTMPKTCPIRNYS